MEVLLKEIDKPLGERPEETWKTKYEKLIIKRYFLEARKQCRFSALNKMYQNPFKKKKKVQCAEKASPSGPQLLYFIEGGASHFEENINERSSLTFFECI